MDDKVLDFLKSNRVCCLATQLKDGSPHTAALHFSHTLDPFALYFSTQNSSRKYQALAEGKSVKGSVTVGFSEQEWITLQMDGEVSTVSDPEELKSAKAIHYPKHPKSQEFENNPATVFLMFTPTWWRYTDINTHPATYINSI